MSRVTNVLVYAFADDVPRVLEAFGEGAVELDVSRVGFDKCFDGRAVAYAYNYNGGSRWAFGKLNRITFEWPESVAAIAETEGEGVQVWTRTPSSARPSDAR